MVRQALMIAFYRGERFEGPILKEHLDRCLCLRPEERGQLFPCRYLNRSFLLMAAYAGLDAAILDPLDARIMSLIKVGDLLTGKDAMCRGYLRAHRRGAIID